MIEKFEYIGEWFLPTNRNNRISGTLTYLPTDGITLNLYGSFDDGVIFPRDKDEGIILGITSDSQQITLSNCFVTQRGSTKFIVGEECGKPTITYSAHFLLIGTHVNNIDDLTFNKISAEIFNLGEWLGISGFKKDIDIESYKNNKCTIYYKLPEIIEFDISKGFKGRFNFSAKESDRTRYQKIVTIKQRVEFEVESQDEETIENLLKYLFTFQNFISLALYRSTYPIAISLRGEKHKKDYGDGELHKKKIELYFYSRDIKFDEKERMDIEMLFTYHKLGGNPNEVIKNWYEKYEMLEPAFDLLFEQFYNKGFTINTFLNLAQSAETFHARVHDHTRIPPNEYKGMKDDILKLVPNKYHEWLKDQFNFGNYLNLHSRLTELIDKYSNSTLDKILGNKEKFVLNVKNSRNYYTHYDKRLEKKALKGADLFYLSERLKILLTCAFLMEIGLTKENIVTNLEWVKWRNWNHLANWRDSESTNHS